MKADRGMPHRACSNGSASLSPSVVVLSSADRRHVGSRPPATHVLGSLSALSAFDSPRVTGVGGVGPSIASYHTER